ncbi:hypothetical protein MTP04_19720 [Lysinibacillus sp. PLM2]|nr:hypothetical protein MTP04_19720 [Lysinibacillus sp. PLM2]
MMSNGFMTFYQEYFNQKIFKPTSLHYLYIINELNYLIKKTNHLRKTIVVFIILNSPN